MRQNRPARFTPGNPFVNLLAGLMTFAGFIAWFMPGAIHAFAPEHLAAPLVKYGRMMLVVGIVLQGLMFFTRIREMKRIMGRARRVAGESREQIPPVAHGDGVADRTDWKPLKGGGANFRTQKLVNISSSRMAVQATIQMKLFSGLFMAMGAGVGGVFVYKSRAPLLSTDTLFPGGIGLLFVLVGAFMLFYFTKAATFDRARGWYWRGKARPGSDHRMQTRKDAARLSEIHALQLISEYVSGGKDSSPYYSYELNLVMKDGSRINVMDHGNLQDIREGADRLSKFLNVPVWDKA